MITGLSVLRGRSDLREVYALCGIFQILMLIQFVEVSVIRYMIQLFVSNDCLAGKPCGIELENHVLCSIHGLCTDREFTGICCCKDFSG